MLLSGRVGRPRLTRPHTAAGTPRLTRPADWIGAVQSCGRWRNCPVLADLGYAGADWQQHWQDYAADVFTPPVWERHSARVWFSSVRQAVETASAALVDSLGLQFPRAHSTWGPLTRIGAKIAARNVGILINRHFDRPDAAAENSGPRLLSAYYAISPNQHKSVSVASVICPTIALRQQQAASR